MMRIYTLSAMLFAINLICYSASGQSSAKAARYTSVNPAGGFIENQGQFVDENQTLRGDLLYLLDREGMKVHLKRNSISFELYTLTNDNNKFDEAVGRIDERFDSEDQPLPKLHYQSHRIDVEFINANPNPEILAEEVLPDYFNYYLAYTPVEGITKVNQYNKITYKNLYPHIDLVLFASFENHSVQSLVYDFVVHPGGKVNDIRYRYHGSNDQVLLKDGRVETLNTLGKMTESIPESYLISKDEKKLNAVNVSFHFSRNMIGFRAESYDKTKSLVIDPLLVWATYCGGDASEEGRGLATDSLGNVAIIGRSNSTNNIATEGAYQTELVANVDIMLEKYDSAGNRFWGTYYGGSQDDRGRGLVADQYNNFYLGCHGNSPDGIATPGSYQPNFSGGFGDDGFLAYFNKDGFREWATYYGGTEEETMRRLSIDHEGNVLLVGYTFSSSGIATPGVGQPEIAGQADLCLSKWSPTGQLIWGSYLGGCCEEHGRSVAVDKHGDIYVNGSTASNDIATPGVSRTTRAGKQDYLLGKFTKDGQIAWVSYWGGAVEDRGRGVFVDSSSSYIYFTGYTASDTGIATPGAYQEHWVEGYSNNGDPYYDVVLMKWTPDGQIVWSTYLGGAKDDRGRAITMIGDNEIYVSGSTESSDVIATPDGFQTVWGGKGDMFLEIFDSTGFRHYGTYFGSTGDEDNLALAIDYRHENIYLVGTSNSSGLATPGTAQTTFGGVDDVLLVKVQIHAPVLPPVASYTYENIPCSGTAVAFTNTSTHADKFKWFFGDGTTSNQESPVHSYSTTGTYSVKLKATNTISGEINTITLSVHVVSTPLIASVTPSGNIEECKGTDVTLTCNNNGSELIYQWRKDGINISGATDQSYTNSKDEGSFTVIVTSTYGCSDTSDPSVIDRLKKPASTITVLGNPDICSTGSVDLQANYGANFIYQWKLNNSNIPGATNQIYHTSLIGNYKVNITNANGCSKTSKPVEIYSSCRESSPNDQDHIELFPNPGSGTFSIRLTHEFINQPVSISVTDISGRILWTEVRVSDNSLLSIQLQPEITGGVYLLTIQSIHASRQKLFEVVR